jgi:hypothetical protein
MDGIVALRQAVAARQWQPAIRKPILEPPDLETARAPGRDCKGVAGDQGWPFYLQGYANLFDEER